MQHGPDHSARRPMECGIIRRRATHGDGELSLTTTVDGGFGIRTSAL